MIVLVSVGPVVRVLLLRAVPHEPARAKTHRSSVAVAHVHHSLLTGLLPEVACLPAWTLVGPPRSPWYGPCRPQRGADRHVLKVFLRGRVCPFRTDAGRCLVHAAHPACWSVHCALGPGVDRLFVRS